jgi:hypothetical protein
LFFFRKLLKEHENKVEPLDHMESIRIMEEILGMQIGLNTAVVRFIGSTQWAQLE